jgi:hypothetical protein
MDRLSLPAQDRTGCASPGEVTGEVIRSEPPGTDPYAGWCGGRGLITPDYPIRLAFLLQFYPTGFRVRRAVSQNGKPSSHALIASKDWPNDRKQPICIWSIHEKDKLSLADLVPIVLSALRFGDGCLQFIFDGGEVIEIGFRAPFGIGQGNMNDDSLLFGFRTDGSASP